MNYNHRKNLTNKQAQYVILSNFKSFDDVLQGQQRIVHEYIGTDASIKTCLKIVRRAISRADYLVLNIDHKRLYIICAIFFLIAPRPFRHCQLVSVDILLRPAFSRLEKITIFLKKLLLSQVDMFILYFKNWEGYVKIYNIDRKRLAYVPFKVNSWKYLRERRKRILQGDYILCAGATLRDYFTFIDAIRFTGLPALLLLPGEMKGHVEELAWYRNGVPDSLRLEFHTDGNESTYLSFFENARILCIPRYGWDIASTGISAYLCGMALGKCVVISSGPGAEDLLEEDKAAAFFKPENPMELGNLLLRLWNNPDQCRQIAENGIRYSDRLEGEERLLNDILKVLSVR